MTVSVLPEGLLTLAESWMEQDPDEQTRFELRSVLDRALAGEDAAVAELNDMFDGTLEFGTAGLRGQLGPGSNRMNRVVVSRAAAGLAAYLNERGGGSIVIGYDARYNSDIFARDTAEIMQGAGITAHLYDRCLPTPLAAYGVRPLGAAAAVMVTASHNPPKDNGYKVYLGDGSQIVPPADADISAHIDAVGDIRDLPRSDNYTVLNNDLVDAYVERVRSLLVARPRDVRAVYTPMHGVGGETFDRVVREAGFPPIVPVVEQFDPDPAFPTVAFPNPEEPGAMDLAIATAERSDADVIIANDPDADRCSAGIRTPTGWRMLTGDEVGSVLGWWIIKRSELSGTTIDGQFAASVVSGTLLRRLAEARGLSFQTTLTGFKWISKVPNLVFGYEEALGYCVDPAAVADKDGISASLLVMELAAWLKEQGLDINDVLAELANEFGLYLTRQLAIRVTDVSLIAAAMQRLRSAPPSHVGSTPIVTIVDLEDGVDGAPPTNGMRFVIADGHITVRPSGTEPKLKCYIEVVTEVTSDVAAARTAGETRIAELRVAMTEVLGL